MRQETSFECFQLPELRMLVFPENRKKPTPIKNMSDGSEKWIVQKLLNDCPVLSNISRRTPKQAETFFSETLKSKMEFMNLPRHLSSLEYSYARKT